jgi:hypothetical protein
MCVGFCSCEHRYFYAYLTFIKVIKSRLPRPQKREMLDEKWKAKRTTRTRNHAFINITHSFIIYYCVLLSALSDTFFNTLRRNQDGYLCVRENCLSEFLAFSTNEAKNGRGEMSGVHFGFLPKRGGKIDFEFARSSRMFSARTCELYLHALQSGGKSIATIFRWLAEANEGNRNRIISIAGNQERLQLAFKITTRRAN